MIIVPKLRNPVQSVLGLQCFHLSRIITLLIDIPMHIKDCIFSWSLHSKEAVSQLIFFRIPSSSSSSHATFSILLSLSNLFLPLSCCSSPFYLSLLSVSFCLCLLFFSATFSFSPYISSSPLHPLLWRSGELWDNEKGYGVWQFQVWILALLFY